MAKTTKNYVVFTAEGKMEFVTEIRDDVPNPDAEFSALLTSGKIIHKKMLFVEGVGDLDIMLGSSEAVVVIPRKGMQYKSVWRDQLSNLANPADGQHKFNGVAPMFVIAGGDGLAEGHINTTVFIPMEHYLQVVLRRNATTNQWEPAGESSVAVFVRGPGDKLFAPVWSNIHDNGNVCTGGGFREAVGPSDSVREAVMKVVAHMDNSMWNDHLIDNNVRVATALDANLKPVFTKEMLRPLLKDARQTRPLGEALIANHKFD